MSRESAIEMLKESHKTLIDTNAMLRRDYETLKKEYEEESLIWQSELASLKSKFDVLRDCDAKEKHQKEKTAKYESNYDIEDNQ